MTGRLTLPDLSRALREAGISSSYQSLWRRVAAGEIPARRDPAGWTFDPADLPEIAATLAVRGRSAA